jgi:radical SAM superfamily enzyme YgiQ (UPF0313 family)
MKVLLIWPPSPLYGHWRLHIPLGLAYIAAVLEKQGHEVKVLDGNFETLNSIEKSLKSSDADIVGISSLTLQINTALFIAKLAKKYINSPVILGGPHPTIRPAEVLKNPYVDFVVIGEGEQTIVELIDEIKSGKENFSLVKGIGYKHGKQLLFTSPRPFITNLDSLPFPARHLFPVERYLKLTKSLLDKKELSIISSRGCPFTCTYCAKEIFGHVYRTRSPKNVVDEIESLIEKYNVERIWFTDDIFTLDQHRALEICDEILRRKLKIEWIAETRVDIVNEKLLKRMREAGCVRIEYGIESGSEKILKVLNKNISLKQVNDAVRLAKASNIITTGFFMLGIPGEEATDILKTFRLIEELDLNHIVVSLTLPLPGTKLYEMVKDKIFANWTKFAYSNNFVFEHDKFPQEVIPTIKLVMEKFFEANKIKKERGRKKFKKIVGFSMRTLMSNSPLRTRILLLLALINRGLFFKQLERWLRDAQRTYMCSDQLWRSSLRRNGAFRKSMSASRSSILGR